MLESVDDDEIILFKSPKITNKKALTFYISIVVLGFNSLFLPLISMVIYSDFGLFGILVLTCVFNAIFLPLGYLVIYRSEKNTCFFLLSNKKLWVYRKGDIQDPKGRNINVYSIKSIKGIIFRKRFFDKNKTSGTIEFLSNDLIPKKITIKNVPHMNTLQNIIESIFFHYGDIQEKWQHFTDDKIIFPQTYEISEVKLAEIKKVNIINGLILVCILPVCYLISYIISLNSTGIFTPIPISILSVGFMLTIMFLIYIIVTMKRTSKRGDKLVFNEGEFSLRSKEKTTFLSLDKTVVVDIKQCKGVYKLDSEPQGLLDNYDYIKISNSYKPAKSIKFGPFVKLPYLIDLIFVYLIIWKSKQGYLLSIEDLIPETQK